MATQDAAHGEVESAQRAMLAERFDGILRTRGSEAARGRQERGDEALVEAYGRYEQVDEESAHKAEELEVSAAETVPSAAGAVPSA